MHQIRFWIGSALALGAFGLLDGCAVYEKCGIKGCPGDAEITAQVQDLIKQHSGLGIPNALTVQTLDHVVYLYGLVDTDLQRQTAGELALQEPGVVRVVNSIALINR